MVGGDNFLWAKVKRAYEGDELTVAEICAKFGVAAGQLKNRRFREGWQPRPGGRMKKRTAAGKTSSVKYRDSGCPSRILSSGCPSPRPSPREETGTGGRKKEVHDCATEGMATDRGQLIERLFRAIETELTIIEERMKNSENRSPADSERDTRSIGALIRNLEKLTEFDGQLRDGGDRGGGGGGKSGAVADITADEADRIRRDLAARIERITKGQGS